MGEVSTDTSEIKSWRSIITLIVFVFTNIAVLFPFHVPIPVPRLLSNAILNSLRWMRVISRRPKHSQPGEMKGWNRHILVLRCPLNFVTAPLIADLFLLALRAIGRQEVHDGTLGANNILPYNIMIFFLTLAYIAISIDCSGLIRNWAWQVLIKGGERGKWLFFYVYVFFFALGSFIGNDPIILTGTAFLAYIYRLSPNITNPRAWIHTQFAVANIASAILVSSNPTNLVLAGAFGIKFITYTANMIVPVFITIIVLFPFLLWVIFPEEKLIPSKIDEDWLTRARALTVKTYVDPNIPDSEELNVPSIRVSTGERGDVELLEDFNLHLNSKSAKFGACAMTATLITLLVVNASDQKKGGKDVPVCYITLPAAFVMLCWDLGSGWLKRKKTQDDARRGLIAKKDRVEREQREKDGSSTLILPPNDERSQSERRVTSMISTRNEGQELIFTNASQGQQMMSTTLGNEDEEKGGVSSQITLESLRQSDRGEPIVVRLVSYARENYRELRATFPTVTAVLSHLPYTLLPFAFSMFVLVQGLVTKGWVAVFAYGWDYWVNTTGTVGAICGMAFVSVILCNFAGTNIGTTILLCRVIQTWKQIHVENKLPISDRTLWGTIYAMALGVNYGAFSAAFSASLAGLLWRDILERKDVKVSRLDFFRFNMPIISIAMAVGCSVLIAQVYIMRSNDPFDA